MGSVGDLIRAIPTDPYDLNVNDPGSGIIPE